MLKFKMRSRASKQRKQRIDVLKELSLSDCYGYAGLTSAAANVSLRLEPFQAIAKELKTDHILDLIRFYFGLPVTADTKWFSTPIIQADPAFSMVANEREVAIIAMALLAREINEKENSVAALAMLVAHACGRRDPIVWPQFVENVSAAARDMAISDRRAGRPKQIYARKLSPELGGSGEDLVTAVTPAELSALFKKLNVDSQDMDKFLASQITEALKPIRDEVANLREEKDMLWWLIGGQSYLLHQPYAVMKEGQAALLIGMELAKLCRTPLGPHASEFLIKKALSEGRTDRSAKVKIDGLPKLFEKSQLEQVADSIEVDDVRDLCFLSNAISRANDLGLPTAWKKKYGEDGGLSDNTSFDAEEVALQSFRETLLLKTLYEEPR
jgi:hypothetical protein